MTPHNSAAIGEIASVVLLPGDPNRATFISTTLLEDAKRVTNVRAMVGYTGFYKGKQISVMGSGMGGPSAGIYSYELFSHYNVEAIVRVGTCGGFKENINVGDLIFALTASTDSNWAHQYDLKGTYSPFADYSLLSKALKVANQLTIDHHVGMVFSSDLFSTYNALGETSWKKWAAMGSLAQDMETYALYSTANYLGKKALSILTMTDNVVTNQSVADEKRLESAYNMSLVALETLKDF
jgi:purine-nucleoside phosphorylase